MKYVITITLLFLSLQNTAQVSLSSGLVAYYPFSNDYKDHSGNGHDGTAHGDMSFTSDLWHHSNAAANFGGDSSWIGVPASVGLTPTKHLSLSFRYKTNVGRIEYILSKSDYSDGGTTDNVQYQILLNDSVNFGSGLTFGTCHNNSCITTSYNPAGYPQDYLSNDTTLSQNSWHCVVLTFDSGQKKMYIDNILRASDTTVGANPHSIDSCINGMLKIGFWWEGGPLYFSGAMDELRIYNRHLNTSEITALCNYNYDSLYNSNGEASSVNALTNDHNIQIFPNPVSNNLSVKLPVDESNSEAIVINQLGQIILDLKFNSSVFSIDVSKLPASTYFLRICNGTFIKTVQFSKN